jgi:hypothetical protein
MKKIMYFLLLFTSIAFASHGEFIMSIQNSNGALISATVNLYYPESYSLYQQGYAHATPPLTEWDNIPCNVAADMSDGQDDTPNPTWSPVNPGTYLLRVKPDNNSFDKYVTIDIPESTPGRNDFLLVVVNGIFNLEYNLRGVSISQSHDWTSVTFQNNFLSDGNGGTITVNNSTLSSPVLNFLFTPGTLVTASAIDQTVIDMSYVFNSWSTGSTSRSITFIPTSGVTYTANFISHVGVSISGPRNIPVSGTWYAKVSGGFSPYSYQWYYQYNGGSWNAAGSGSTLTKYIGTTGYVLKVEVLDSRNYTASCQYTVGSPDPKISVGSSNAKLSKDAEVKDYFLEQNSPNPFNPSTLINYQVANDGFVSLKVYDILGREVKTLVNEVKTQGKYSVIFDAANLTSGIYIYQLKANGFSSYKKMILTK